MIRNKDQKNIMIFNTAQHSKPKSYKMQHKYNLPPRIKVSLYRNLIMQSFAPQNPKSLECHGSNEVRHLETTFNLDSCHSTAVCHFMLPIAPPIRAVVVATSAQKELAAPQGKVFLRNYSLDPDPGVLSSLFGTDTHLLAGPRQLAGWLADWQSRKPKSTHTQVRHRRRSDG